MGAGSVWVVGGNTSDGYWDSDNRLGIVFVEKSLER